MIQWLQIQERIKYYRNEVYSYGNKILQNLWKRWSPSEDEFGESMIYDFSKNGDKRVFEILNSDVLGHNDFSILGITRNTFDEVKSELQSQLEDGLFECCSYGKVEEFQTLKLKK